MAKQVLEFEKPILELEQKIEEMRRYADNPDIAQEIARIEKRVMQLQQSVYSGLTRWQKVQIARHPDRPYTLDYINLMTKDFIELHGDRTFRDDKAIVGGFGTARRPGRHDHRPPEGAGHEVECLPELRHAESGGVPEGAAADEAGREVRQAGHHAARHARRVSRPRSGGARAGRGDRPQPARDGAAQDADHRRHHRGGGLRRRARHRRRRPDPHARERVVLRHLAGVVFQHPLAELELQGAGGRGAPADARPTSRSRGSST